MKPPDHAHCIELEVPFHDVDGLRIVWHGHYLKYLEIGRTGLMRSQGLDWSVLVEMGFGMLVTETLLRHSFPLHYADRFRVATWCIDTEHRIKLGFEVFNLTRDRRAARGHTTLVTTDTQGALLYETPHAIRSRLGR